MLLLSGVFHECGPGSGSQPPQVRDICCFLLATAVSGRDIWAPAAVAKGSASDTAAAAAAGGGAGAPALDACVPTRCWQGLDVVGVSGTEQVLHQACQVAKVISSTETCGQQHTQQLEKVGMEGGGGGVGV
jgi:hypothetical protein